MKIFTLFVLCLFSGVLVAQERFEIRNPEIIEATFLGESKPLRDFVPDPNYREKVIKPERLGYHPKKNWPLHESVNPNALPKDGDPALQKNYSPARGVKDLELNIDGLGYTFVNPSDPNVDVGPNHVIQMINGGGTQYQIWDKSGNSLFGPASFAATIGGTGWGDPIVIYDQLADRWLMSEFGLSNSLFVAVSATSDPLGTWYTYTFSTPGFPDYPKYSVWPDAYYVTTNESTLGVYALDRAAMLAGTPATAQRFSTPRYTGVGFQANTPVALTGLTVPPPGTPAMFMRMADDAWDVSIPNDRLEIYELSIDFATPANSVLSGPTFLATDPFDTELNGFNAFAAFPQPGSGILLDPLREVLMYQVQYRNFGTHESIVCNHVTDVDGNDRGGIRWYELRKSGNDPWTIFQQGTYSPDADNRWMGAIAINGHGDIGLMYNITSGTTYPGIRYTGRKAGDPPGTMTEGETTIGVGLAANGSNRYGDYNSLSVDPLDETTFWGTAQYNPTSQWSTKIVAFEITNGSYCTGDNIFYVNDDAAGLNDGSTWNNAFNDLQFALEQAELCPDITQVWVATGTYYPNLGIDRNTSFVMQNNLAIYGGLAGTEAPDYDMSLRDFVANETILSGDLLGDDGPDFANNGDNSYHVLKNIFAFGNELDNTAVLDGFTITGGNANGSDFAAYGGGMFNYYASPIVRNCSFSGNAALSGGGLANHYCDLNLTVTDCSFIDNSAGDGGGVFNFYSSTMLSNVTFLNNSATSNGGGLRMSDSNPSPLNNVVFSNNSAQNGGGIFSSGSNMTIINASFSNNLATAAAGGIYYSQDVPTNLFVTNSILWGNRNGADEISSFYSNNPGSIIANNSDIEQDSGVFPGTDNLNIDPLFVDPATDNLYLQSCSPVIDAGTSVDAPASDIEGLGRVDAIAGGSIVDMGAHEYQSVLSDATHWFVDAAAAASGNGTSWACAFNDLQTALAIAVPDADNKIWVAAGAYYPTSGTDRNISFVMKNGVAIYGGFDGTEDPLTFDLADRDFVANETILSGDIDQNDGPDFTNNEGNSLHVIFNNNNGLNSSSVLDGFTITGGNADGAYPDNSGAGMFNYLSSPVVGKCNFIQNSASSVGGAMYNISGNISLSDCNFNDNFAGWGGAIATHATLGYSVDHTLINCDFTGNIGTGGGGAINHGFVGSTGSGLFECINCTFIDNISFNGSNYGGGGAFFNEEIGFDGKFTNCLFDGNQGLGSEDWGGGAFLIYEGNCTIINSTIVNSVSATVGGAISIWSRNSVVELKNSVLWNNTADSENSIYNGQGGSVNVEYCLLHDNGCPADVSCGDGMIYNHDPLFVASDDFHLQPCSPAIDAGTDAGAPTDDLDGNPRPFSPMGYVPATVDMGCYEYSMSTDVCSICPAIAFAGNDAGVFPGDNYEILDAAAENYISVFWSTAGDGAFDDPTILNPIYTPGPNDISAGGVELTLSIEGMNSCGIGDDDQMTLAIYQPPTVEITYPFEGDVLYDYLLTVTGTAADINGDLTEVYVNLNGGGWELATGTDAWTKDLTLAIGENQILAKAVDAQGLESDVAEVNFILSVQVVPLMQGWSVISSFLIPLDPVLELVMADVGIPGNLTIMLGKEGIFWPEHNINSIGDWNVFEGYKVKFKNVDELLVHGEKPMDNNVTFSAGFHLMPVLSNVPVQVSQIFSDPENDVKYLFDLSSGQIYWPQGGVLTLSELIPGKGYLANFNTEVTIDFPDITNLKSAFIHTDPVVQSKSPWDYSATGDVHLISIDHVSAEAMKDVSHIGAFDVNGYCIGSAEINHTNENYLLTVFGDDETTSKKDGASTAEFLTFKAYSQHQNLEYEIIPEFSNNMPDYSGQFKANGMSSIVGFKDAATGIGGNTTSGLQVDLFPNPARDVVTLICPDYTTDAQFEAEFVNSGGKFAKKIELTGKSTNIDLDGMNPGVYFVKITSETGTVIKKLVIQ